jgi:hypothetical protein
MTIDLLAVARDAERALASKGPVASVASVAPPDEIPDGPPWPAPLSPEAFHGPVGDLVRAIEPHSEADLAALLVQLHVMFGNAVGRGPFFRVEADSHHTNLFVLVVGRTSGARKGSGFGRIRSVFHDADEDWLRGCVASGLSSGEGLIYHVRDPIEKHEPIREEGEAVRYRNVILDKGVTDKRLLVVETEFAGTLKVMGREGNTLSSAMRQVWDTGNARVLTKNSPVRATDAHVSIIGHVTGDELQRALSRTDVANGFLNRFLVVGARRSKCLPEGGLVDPDSMRVITRRIAHALASARMIGEMKRDPAASALWATEYPALSEGRPGLLGAATSRAAAQVVRLSLVYALLDECNEVRLEHLQAALAVWRYCEASAGYVFGESLGDPIADELLRVIRRSDNGLTKTQIRDHFARHGGKEIGHALNGLMDQGLVRREDRPTGGRPEQLYRSATEATIDTKEPDSSLSSLSSQGERNPDIAMPLALRNGA